MQDRIGGGEEDGRRKDGPSGCSSFSIFACQGYSMRLMQKGKGVKDGGDCVHRSRRTRYMVEKANSTATMPLLNSDMLSWVLGLVARILCDLTTRQMKTPSGTTRILPNQKIIKLEQSS